MGGFVEGIWYSLIANFLWTSHLGSITLDKSSYITVSANNIAIGGQAYNNLSVAAWHMYLKCIQQHELVRSLLDFGNG